MAYRQKTTCDTYFVEEAQHPAYRKYPTVGEMKEQALADELSRQASEDYETDMVAHMKQMESITLADANSIDIQQEIKWFMRPYLIDFLVEAHGAFQLLPETLFLAVNLLDRYCSRRVVYKRHYQLVGCAALLIAAKYGDKKEKVPLIRELKSMCCSLYDEDMFQQMEWHVLNTLEWMVGHPTVDYWVKLAVKDLVGAPTRQDIEVHNMALYIAETSMYHKEFVSVKPSVVATASLALARGILGRSTHRDVFHLEVNQVLVLLSQKLDPPSTVLFRKYDNYQTDRVASTLMKFLEREALSRRPATPVYEHKPAYIQGDSFPETPQKIYGNVVNGYITPPITPEGECSSILYGPEDAHTPTHGQRQHREANEWPEPPYESYPTHCNEASPYY